MIANDGSELMRTIYATYLATRMLGDDKPASDRGTTDGVMRLRKAKDELMNSMRDQLGVAHWLSSSMRKALGSVDDQR